MATKITSDLLSTANVSPIKTLRAGLDLAYEHVTLKHLPVQHGTKFEDSNTNRLNQSIFTRGQRCPLAANYVTDGVASFVLEVTSFSCCPEL